MKDEKGAPMNDAQRIFNAAVNAQQRWEHFRSKHLKNERRIAAVQRDTFTEAYCIITSHEFDEALKRVRRAARRDTEPKEASC